MSNIKPHLAILGANLIYGVNYSIAKDVMPTFIKPFGFIFCRVLGALILFTLVSSFFKEKIEKRFWTFSHLWIFWGCSQPTDVFLRIKFN